MTLDIQDGRRLRYFGLLACVGLLIGCAHSKPHEAQVKPFTFVQLCDVQLGFGGYEDDVQAFSLAVEKINTLKPDFVVICGDLVHLPEDRAFADFRRIRATLAVPSYCAPGNHDVGGEPNAKTLARYREMFGADYYRFTHKGHEFVVVNTQLWKSPVEGETEKQDAWLAETLAAARRAGRPVIVVGHIPLFIKEADEPDEYFNLPSDKRSALLELYREHGVIAVLTGHVHKTLINEYQGILLVTGETTSRNFDQRPRGFRLWTVETPSVPRHEFVPLRGTPDE